jgi:monovalent cation/hydrogen antiporter
MHSAHSAQLTLVLLLLAVVVFALIAQRLRTPYPIVLVLAGLALSLVPGVPRITLDPAVVFYVFLPPLVWAAAWNTSWRELRYNGVSILLLAVGLVTFTVLSVAGVAHWLFHGMRFRTGFLLGAVVSTTDAIAATAIFRRLGIERRIVDILEGESLMNDATGLLALEFGLTMIAGGAVVRLPDAVARLAILAALGLAIGLGLGAIVSWLERRLDDAPIEIAISFITPYAAYFAAEAAGGSGVLAVVACALFASRRSAYFFSPGVRIQVTAVWSSLTFILNGIVFMLVGLQLPYVLGAIRGMSVGRLLLYGASFSALVIALRLVWELPGAYIGWLIRRHLLRQDEPPPALRNVLMVGWTGLRGVLALAAAMSIPASMPYRNLIVFLTFCVIVTTLVVQGLTLPLVIRLLGIGSDSAEAELEEARRTMLESALRRLESLRDADPRGGDALYEDIAQHYRVRLEASEDIERYRQISRELLRHERQEAVEMRNRGAIGDDVLRELLRELDLSEERLG